MRITNGMIINNTLNNMYRNLGALNKTYAQMSTGKKIQTVSDNPIIAGRALKLNTTVLETTQYERNVKEAISWMDITESGLNNITEILKTIRTKFVQASSGTLGKEDKEKIRTQVEQLWTQIQEESNQTYSGRYVFSGYKTGEPMMLTASTTLEKDLTVTKELPVSDGSKIAAGSTVKKDSSFGSGSVLGIGTNIPAGSTLTEGTKLSAQEAQKILGITLLDTEYTLDAEYTITAGTEISKEAAKHFRLGPIEGETYIVGEGGHKVTKGTKLPKDIAEEVLGVTVSKDSYTITADIETTSDITLEGDMILGLDCKFNGDITLAGDSNLTVGTNLAVGSIMKVGSELPKGAFNPKVYGLIDGHAMEYEIGVGSTIVVNTEDMDDTMAEMAKCFNEVFSTLNQALNSDTVTNEELHIMFNDKLDEIDKIIAGISEKTSDLGSRMNRTEYTASRLADQKIAFKNLLSETEDIDIEEVYTNFNVQYATYQSALQATSKIITNTLADYL